MLEHLFFIRYCHSAERVKTFSNKLRFLLANAHCRKAKSMALKLSEFVLDFWPWIQNNSKEEAG